jgi:hypothetical protein
VLDRLSSLSPMMSGCAEPESQVEVLRGFAETRCAAQSWDQERRDAAAKVRKTAVCSAAAATTSLASYRRQALGRAEGTLTRKKRRRVKPGGSNFMPVAQL